MIDGLRRLLKESEDKALAAQRATEEAHAAKAAAEEAARRAERAKREGMFAAAGQLESIVNVISSAATQLSSQIEQSNHSATESATRLSEAAAMNEMNSTVQDVARNAGSASQMSGETRNKASEGAEIVRKALKSIQRVHDVSLALKTDMAQLNTHAQAIDQIMGVISDIADQTNLLALNAAIEAARAGEAGRGFAVVADEVRKLAEKTMSSAGTVHTAVTSIQQSTRTSVEQMEVSMKLVEESTELAEASDAALVDIVNTIGRAVDQVKAIADASEQQSTSSTAITRNIQHVSDIAEGNAQAMLDAANSLLDVMEQVQILRDLVDELIEKSGDTRGRQPQAAAQPDIPLDAKS